MTTYHELKQQAADLLAQAEQLRQQEKASVIASVRQQVEEYGITARELGFTATGGVAVGRRRSSAVVKYVSPDGATWSGRGRKPRWLAAALDMGRSLQEFVSEHRPGN